MWFDSSTVMIISKSGAGVCSTLQDLESINTQYNKTNTSIKLHNTNAIIYVVKPKAYRGSVLASTMPQLGCEGWVIHGLQPSWFNLAYRVRSCKQVILTGSIAHSSDTGSFFLYQIPTATYIWFLPPLDSKISSHHDFIENIATVIRMEPTQFIFWWNQ